MAQPTKGRDNREPRENGTDSSEFFFNGLIGKQIDLAYKQHLQVRICLSKGANVSGFIVGLDHQYKQALIETDTEFVSVQLGYVCQVFVIKTQDLKAENPESFATNNESFMEWAKKHPHGSCKQCGKPTFNTDFCSQTCAEAYKAGKGAK